MNRFLTPVALLISSTYITHAATIMSDAPVAASGFSDGSRDYFGVVETGGITIGGILFESSLSPAPPVGSVTGRDQDDGGSRSGIESASWTIDLPTNAVAGTGFTGISFDSTSVFAANQWDTVAGGGGSSLDFARFELLLNNVVVETREYRPDAMTISGGNLLLNGDLSGVNLSTGAPVSLSFSNPGGATITAAELRLTVHSSLSAEEHWTQGTLTGDFTAVPEPTASLLLAFGLFWGGTRRKRV